MPLISVVLPTYNSVDTVERAIQSVFAQIFTEWELIVIDDASTDRTVELVRERFGADPRVKILQGTVNGGPSPCEKCCYHCATSEWIALLDSDDAWSVDRLKTLYSERGDFDFIADNIMTYDAIAKTETGPLFDDFDSSILRLDDLLLGWVGNRKVDGGYLKPIMRSQFLREAHLSYNCNLRQGEDFVFYCEALCQRARFHLLDKPGYIYTTSVGELSGLLSPHSRTRPDPIAMSEALRPLIKKYAHYLNDHEVWALERFVMGLSRSKWSWAFEAAKKNRDYPLCLELIVRHHSVRRSVLGALLSDMGFRRPSKRPREHKRRTLRGFYRHSRGIVTTSAQASMASRMASSSGYIEFCERRACRFR